MQRDFGSRTQHFTDWIIQPPPHIHVLAKRLVTCASRSSAAFIRRDGKPLMGLVSTLYLAVYLT